MARQQLLLGAEWPPKHNRHPIPLAAIMPLRELYVPKEFDTEVNLTGSIFPARMWANDRKPCCVVSAQANHTRRLEYIEQGFIVNITDDDVIKCWRAQAADEFSGLYTLDAYKCWVTTGWDITGGRLNSSLIKTRGCWSKWFKEPPTPESTRQHLDIHVFADLDSIEEIMAAIYYLHGCQMAVQLYQRDMDKFEAREPWTMDDKDQGAYIGGHMIDLPAFEGDGSIDCWTWKRRQKMTPDWINARRYDIKAVVDNRDKFLANSPVDVEKAEDMLNQIKAG